MTIDTNSYAGVTILLVEDDDVDVMAVARAFKRLKIANPILRAHDGLEALSMLRQQQTVKPPFIILLDINMPRMNGLEMLAELRNDPTLSHAVVFVLTTSKDDEDKMSAYKQHVAGYIVKSEVGDGFLRVIEMLDHYWRVVELPVASGVKS